MLFAGVAIARTKVCFAILLVLTSSSTCCVLLAQVQLILPEALKLLPLYSLALHKSSMLRPDVRADDRSSWLAGVVGASPQRTMGLLHPRLFAVHNLLVRTSAVTGAAPAYDAASACKLDK